jgi:BASS family bile acid:Na+ symporter
MLDRLILPLLCLLSWAAYRWDQWFTFDPFVATKGWLLQLFAGTMFIIGMLLPRDELMQVFRNWRAVVSGTAIQYTAMPVTAWALATAFDLTGADYVGVILAGCVPGAMASNVLTLMGRGNVSYSVCLTTSATLLSPLVVPAALWLTLGQKVDFPFRETMWTLTWTVVIPVVAGFFVGRLFTRQRAVLSAVGSVIANLTILWIIAVVVALNRSSVSQVTWLLPTVLLLLNVIGYAAGYVGALVMRLDRPMRRALTLEIGMQNAGLGSTLAISLFAASGGQAVALAPALYTFGCMLTGTILAASWGMFDDVRARRVAAAAGPADGCELDGTA